MTRPPPACPIPSPPGRRPAYRRREEGGLALLLVLLLSLILLPFASEFGYQVWTEARTAANVTDQLKIENALDGQMELMLARFKYDANENETDSEDDSWNAEELRERQEQETGVAITTHVFDEKSKLNIRQMGEGSEDRRMLIKKRFERLLIEYRRETPYELGQSEAEEWAAKVYEYLNKGAVRANIPTPRTVDDRPILVLEELDFLREIGGKKFSFLLYDQRKDDKVSPGLHRYITIYGDGKINLNTVDLIVLKALFPQNPELTDRILERRDSPPEDDGSTATPPTTDETTNTGNPYTDVNQINEVDGVTPKSLEDNQVVPGTDFDVESNFFSLRMVGETDVTRREELVVIERVPGPGQDDPLEGFRFLLRQERTDALEHLASDDQ